MTLMNVPVPLADGDPEEEVGSIEDERLEQIMLRPDGYYWEALDGKQEFGPFEDIESALADMELSEEDSPEPGETLEEAEDEIGISSWIDPDTGELAEGQSTPRLESW